MMKKNFCLFLLGLFCLYGGVFSEENISPIDLLKSNKTVKENPAPLAYEKTYEDRLEHKGVDVPQLSNSPQKTYEAWLEDRGLDKIGSGDKKLDLYFDPCKSITLPTCPPITAKLN